MEHDIPYLNEIGSKSFCKMKNLYSMNKSSFTHGYSNRFDNLNEKINSYVLSQNICYIYILHINFNDRYVYFTDS